MPFPEVWGGRLRRIAAQSLGKDKALVDGLCVDEIIEYESFPLIGVAITTRDRLTREEREHRFGWDEQVDVYEPLCLRVTDTALLSIVPARLEHHGRVLYRWAVKDTASGHPVDAQGVDIESGVGQRVDCRKTMGTLLSFLGQAGEQYRAEMDGKEVLDRISFPEPVFEWAYIHDFELGVASIDLGGGLSR